MRIQICSMRIQNTLEATRDESFVPIGYCNSRRDEPLWLNPNWAHFFLALTS
jgi:hypothetical protein